MYRRLRGHLFTQQQIADMSGTSQAHVCLIELGKREPSIADLIAYQYYGRQLPTNADVEAALLVVDAAITNCHRSMGVDI